MFPEQIALTFRPVVVTPTYNNAATLADVLSQIRAIGYPLIVVNDGSTDQTAQILARLEDAVVLTHPGNLGKAAALRTGFDAALTAGYTHAITIDTDGQHDPAQIPDVAAIANANRSAIILGCRDASAVDYPKLSRLGRWAANTLIRWESGLRVDDSQCGLRVYPLERMSQWIASAPRYGFESEVLTRAAWARCPVVEVPVRCRYLPPGQRVSHYRITRDSLRAAAMHAMLLPIGLCLCTPRHLRKFAHWLSPMKTIRALRREEGAPRMLALGLAVGVFIACLPLYGVQTLLCLFAARKFKLHPLPVVAGGQLSIPPVAPLLIFLCAAVGHVVLHGEWPAPVSLQVMRQAIVSPAALRGFAVDWCVGGVLVGFALALATYATVRLTIGVTRRSIRRRRLPVTNPQLATE